MGTSLVPLPALAQPAPALTCRDANEIIAKKTPDAYFLGALGAVVRTTFKDQDADRVGGGNSSISQDWSEDEMTGQVMAVLLSCRDHSVDTLEKRTADLFKAYLIRHAA